MGHEMHYDTFKVTTSKKDIYNEVNDRAIEEGDYHSSLSAIKFYENECFNSREDAERFISEHDSFYGQLAVKFKQTDFEPSKKLKALYSKTSEAFREYGEINCMFFAKDFKSDTIGCKQCGSKLSRKYLHSNFCPLCHNDLRPATLRKRIEAAKAKYEKCQEQQKTCEKEERLKNIAKGKSQTFWLVKTEFHV